MLTLWRVLNAITFTFDTFLQEDVRLFVYLWWQCNAWLHYIYDCTHYIGSLQFCMVNDNFNWLISVCSLPVQHIDSLSSSANNLERLVAKVDHQPVLTTHHQHHAPGPVSVTAFNQCIHHMESCSIVRVFVYKHTVGLRKRSCIINIWMPHITPRGYHPLLIWPLPG